MGKAPTRPCLATGWLLSFLWPVAVGCILLVLGRDGGDLLFWLLVLIACGMLIRFFTDVVLRIIRWAAGLLTPPNPYGCPVCGYDIRMTPHRCPECGTRLVWGQLPVGQRRKTLGHSVTSYHA